jgi:hypothetical protein
MFADAGLAASCLLRFDIPQEFGQWVARIGTAPDAIVGLRALCDAAPDEVRGHFAIRAHGDYAFKLDGAVLLGVRR